MEIKDYIPGSEVLLEKEEIKPAEKNKSKKKKNNDDSDSDEWVDVASSDSELNISDSDESDDDTEEEDSKNETEDDNNVDEIAVDKAEASPRKILKGKRKLNPKTKQENVDNAREIAMDKIFTDEDFKRIEAAQVKKNLTGTKRKHNVVEDEAEESSELVKLSNIENIFKKRKHDKNARIETVLKGREEREKFGYKDRRKNIHCSKTNREKRKTKNYQMVKHKAKGKVKRSFKEKQIAFRNYLIKQKKMK